jgi:transposase-like protein
MCNCAGTRSSEGAVPVKIDRIRQDGGTQQRARLNQAVVAQYADAMSDGGVFPPVEVWDDGTEYWLSDGFHRLAAASLCRRDTIQAIINRGTVSEAVWHSFGTNTRHGLRRTCQETRNIVTRALKHSNAMHLSNNRLAAHLGIPESTLRRWRKEVRCVDEEVRVRTVSRNGVTYQIRIDNIGSRVERGPRKKSVRQLQSELHSMKTASPPDVRRVLNIIEKWIFAGTSTDECLLALTRAAPHLHSFS